MEKEVNGRGIIFEGDEIKYGQSYLISIRDAAVTVTLKSKFSSKPHVPRLPFTLATNVHLLHQHWCSRQTFTDRITWTVDFV